MSAQSYPAKSPYCEHFLDPATAVDGRVTCPCGRSSDVTWVTELGWLQARSAWVADRVSSGERWFDSRTGRVAETPVPDAAGSGQKVLYILGALSFITAVAVFVAVAWQDIGALGQFLALMVVAAISAVAAVRTRTELSGLANTAAVLASGVAFTALITATQFGLLPEWWMSESSFYPALCVGGVGIASVAAGSRWRLAGWLIVGAPAMPAAALILIEVNAQHFLDRRFFAAFSLIALTFAILAIDYRIRLIMRIDPPRFLNIAAVYVLGQLLLALIATGSLTAMTMGGESSITDGIGVLLTAGLWVLIARRWLPDVNGTSLTNLVSHSARFLAPGLFGYAVTVLALPGADSPTATQVWIFYLATGLVGSALLLMTQRPATTIAAAVLLFTAATNASTFFFMNESHSSYFAATVFFGLVTIALGINWWRSNHGVYFVLLNVTGVFTLINLLNGVDAARYEFELFTAPIAVWFMMTMATVRHRLGGHLNTGVWLGIPLAALLIPSAAISVVQIQLSDVSTYDWARMWIVLGVSVLFTVVGAYQRIAGLLWPAAVAYVMCTFPQLFVDIGLGIPRWVFFAFLSGLLIATATRFEHLQKLRHEAGSWDSVFR